ncbi:hypothetical protein BDW22DRAFT_1349414 [Trametopsis cervina]|nr:hypothetical protein BDW22DRAFT_1349414 [Trametopsis cervina]
MFPWLEAIGSYGEIALEENKNNSRETHGRTRVEVLLEQTGAEGGRNRVEAVNLEAVASMRVQSSKPNLGLQPLSSQERSNTSYNRWCIQSIGVELFSPIYYKTFGIVASVPPGPIAAPTRALIMFIAALVIQEVGQTDPSILNKQQQRREERAKNTRERLFGWLEAGHRASAGGGEINAMVYASISVLLAGTNNRVFLQHGEPRVG